MPTCSYTNGNGDDTIQGAHEGDVVYLAAITMGQISGSDFSGGDVTINFTDGGKLTVKDAESSKCAIVLGGTEEQTTYYVSGGGYTTEK